MKIKKKRVSVDNLKRTKVIRLAEHIGVLLLGCLVVYGILYKTGTINSGYHFLDDHELIRMEVSFEQQSVSLLQSIKNWMVGDFHWRFRPLYWIERVTGAYFWGSELLYWNYYTAIKGIFTFYCLYFTARYLKYDRIISLIMPCVVMLGSQFTPWYRSANQENTGLLLCAFTLCMIAAQAYRKKYQSWCYNIPIMIGAFLCGLVKESFTLFMPAFIALKFWLEYWDEDYAESGKKRFIKCLKNNVLTYTVIMVSMLVNVCMIAFYVGVDKVSYAGFQEGTSLAAYLSGIKNSLMMYTIWYTMTAVAIIILAVMCYKSIGKNDIKKYWGLLCIGGFVMATQLVAHAKSGMWERYIIPYILGYVFVFVLLAYRIFEKDKVHKTIFIGVMLFLIYQHAPVAYKGAQDYAYTGKMVNQLLTCIRDNTAEADSIICAFADEELNIATECWLETNDRTQVYTWSGDEFKNLVQIMGTAPTEYSASNANAIVCYDWQIEEMLQWMAFESEEQYAVHRFGAYAVVIRE